MIKSEKIFCMIKSEKIFCMIKSEKIFCMIKSEKIFCMIKSEKIFCMIKSEKIFCMIKSEKIFCMKKSEKIFCMIKSEKIFCMRKSEKIFCMNNKMLIITRRSCGLPDTGFLSQKIFIFIVKSRFKNSVRSRKSTFALLDVLKSFIKLTSLFLQLYSCILFLISFVAGITYSA